MKYEDRTKLIFDFLFSEREGILRRYKAPEFLTPDRRRQEITDMVSDINAEIPSHFGERDMDRLFAAYRGDIRRMHATRSWPTIKTLLAALTEAIGKIQADGGGQDTEDFMLDRMTIWYRKFGDEMPACGSEERTDALIKRGVLTPAEARKACFQMSKETRDKAAVEQRQIEMPDMRMD